MKIPISFQFHETWRMENMFKKTLLALAVAGSTSAFAGTLAVSVTETAAQVATFNGAKPATCAEAASQLGVSLTVGAFEDTAGADTVADATDGGLLSAGQLSTAANAVTLTGDDACSVTINKDVLTSATSAKYSAEGAAANGVTIDATLASGIGGFTVEDTVVFTVTGGTVDEDATLAANASLSGVGGLNVSAGADAHSQFTLLGVVGNTILFTVDTNSQVNGADAAIARELVRLENVVVVPDEGVTEISVSAYTQNTANVKYDTTDAEKLVNIAKQYSATVHVKGDGVVDVQKERLQFATNSDDSSNTWNDEANEAVLNDTFVVKVTENTVVGNLTPVEGTIKIEGNFSWIADYAGEDGELSATEIENAFSYDSYDSLTNGEKTVGAADDSLIAGETTLSEDYKTLTFKVDVGADDDVDAYHEVVFNTKGFDAEAKVTLAETTFTGSIDFDSNTATKATDLNVVTDAVVAEWTLNGSVVNVPYIPFGPSTQPIIRHTNKGVQTGDISVRYMVEGSSGNTETNEWKSLGILVEDAKPGVRNILSVIQTALEEELGTNKFKVALEITTNVPAEDVTIYAAAKVDVEGQDRLTIGAFGGASAN
jgi:hypothetical protein